MQKLVKHIHVILDDGEFDALKRAKGDRQWKEVLMEILKVEPSENSETSTLPG